MTMTTMSTADTLVRAAPAAFAAERGLCASPLEGECQRCGAWTGTYLMLLLLDYTGMRPVLLCRSCREAYEEE